MNIAFYAPLKPPTHVTPSGDRRMARLFMRAWELGGHRVHLASTFRSFDSGDATRQARLKKMGEKLAQRLIRHYDRLPREQRPNVWFTYHLYHKAPDWIGPTVSKALNIPYVLAEASFAPKQAGGRWAIGHEGAAHAIRHADLVFNLNPNDEPCLGPLLKQHVRQVALPPFMDIAPYDPKNNDWEKDRKTIAQSHGVDAAIPWLLCVAMMRKDQKLRSYEVLSLALNKITDRPWHLFIAGTGVAEPMVHSAFKALKDRVTWLGFQNETDLLPLYAACDVFVWPAIKESYGMVFLEALSSGTPVVAGYSPGVASIVRHERNGLLCQQHDADGFAKSVDQLLCDPPGCKTMGLQGHLDMSESHSLHRVSEILNTVLQGLSKEAAA